MSRRAAAIARAAAPLAVVACAAAVLFWFPPGQYGFYPQCPVWAAFHIECPGCGTTRALAALLHGDVLAALRLNALTTLMLPFVATYAGVCYRRYLRREAFRWPQIPAAGVYAGIAASLVFMVVRNLA